MGACAIPSSMKAKEKKKKKDFTFKSSVFKILDYKSRKGNIFNSILLHVEKIYFLK
jgi:hypothetical protein